MPSAEDFYIEKPDAYFSILRIDILEIIQREDIVADDVLSIGCGSGVTEREIKKRFGSHVTVIEYDKRYAPTLDANFDDVHIADVSEVFLEQQFDLIIYPDVLEHIADPWSLLRRHVEQNLRVGGRVLISIPNVQYYQIILGLLLGRFRYTSRGILDIGHLRFFTKTSLANLCVGSGLRVDRIYRKIRLIDLAEWKCKLARVLSSIFGKLSPLIDLLRFVPIANDFLSFKFTVLCTKPGLPEDCL